MLTVKHIDDGIERILEAPHGVVYRGPHSPIGPQGLLILNGPDEFIEEAIVQGGFAYVMNGAGQTVAKYELPGGREPAQTAA